MAACGKQQQQKQKQQFYLRVPAHPIPPQPAYKGPPPPPSAPRQSGSGCCLFKVIVIVVILLVASSILLWLILRQGAVKATAVSATLSRFDLALADGPPGGGFLEYNLTVDIRVRNTNSYRINYGYTEAMAVYDGERFCYDPVEPFYQEGKSERTITVAFVASSPLLDDGDAVRTYRRERSDGFYFLKVTLSPVLSFKIRASNLNRRSEISCTLRLPVPNTSATPATTLLRTKCDVGLEFYS